MILKYSSIAINKKNNLINEVIIEEDDEKNKICKKKENNHINKNFKSMDNKKNMQIKERNIHYLPYDKFNIRKHNSELLLKRKNIHKNGFSSESNSDKRNNRNLFYNGIINYSTHSSYKNLFSNKIKLSIFDNNIKEKIKINKNNFLVEKGKNLSSLESNSDKNIFDGKIYNNNLIINEKLIKEKSHKESMALPDLNPKSTKNKIMKRENEKLNTNIKRLSKFKEKSIFDERRKNTRTKSVPTSEKIKINYNNTNKIVKNSINNFSSSTSAYTNSTKKINPNNNVTDDLSKYRLGLLSAGTSSYNNVIIPMLSLKRPESNLNFGRGKLWSNTAGAKLKNKNKIKEINGHDNIFKEKEDNIIFKTNKTNLNRISDKMKITYKNQIYNEKVSESENNDLTYKNINELIPKFHKIKIEKGMMNTNITNSIGKNIFKYFNQNNINNNFK